MKNPINITPSYKPSPQGPIPNDWEVTNLDKLIENTFSGGTPSRTVREYYENGTIPWIKSGEINQTYINKTEEYITQIGLNNSSCKIAPKGTLLYALYGATAGVVGFTNIDAALNQAILAIFPQQNKLIKEFLFYFFEYQKESILKEFTQGGQPNLSASLVKELKIKLPPLPEQKAIASVLSTWDEAIQATTQLIKAKERQKGALTQKLLSGRVRLKGFNDKWRFEKIASIAKEVSIRNKEDRDFVVLSCTKYKGLVPSLEYFGRKIFADDLTTYKIVPKNHFAYATNHIEEGSIGYQAQLEAGLISPMYTVFKTDGSVDDDFMFKLLKSHDYIHEYNKRMEGSIDRRGGLRWEEFSKIKIPVPSLEEQAAISMVLQTADKEIMLLKSKLDSLKEQKKGLMQQLLTGKKRLKINQN